MRTVTNGDVVHVHYTGTLDTGETFDSSEGREPLQFKVGSDHIIKGFNDEIMGMELGEEKEFSLPPELAYGHRDEGLVRTLPKSMIGGQFEPKEGMTIGIQLEDGSRVPGTISEVTAESFDVDLNPPLAGQTLTFKVKVVDIKDAASCGCSCSSTCSPCSPSSSSGGCGCSC